MIFPFPAIHHRARTGTKKKEPQALPPKRQGRIAVLASLDASRDLWRVADRQRILRGASAPPQDLEGIRAASHNRQSCPLGTDIVVLLRVWPVRRCVISDVARSFVMTAPDEREGSEAVDG